MKILIRLTLGILVGLTPISRGHAQPAGLLAAPVVVANSDYAGQNGNTGGAVIGYPFAQTFTAAASGSLFSLSAGFYHPQIVAEPYYIFQFRNTTPAGLPGNQVIASVNTSTTPLRSGSGWLDLTADFSSFGINLVAGQKYAFSIDLPGPLGSTVQNSFFWGLTGGGYAGGESYYMTSSGTPQLVIPGEDFLFTVRATPVPEPTLLLPAGLVGLWALRRQRQG